MIYHFEQVTCQSTFYNNYSQYDLWIAIDFYFLCVDILQYVCYVVSFQFKFPIVYLYYSQHTTPQACIIALILIVFK